MAAEKQECMIIGASPIKSGRIFQEFDPKKYFVICADAGYETAQRYHIDPDMIVGDFDSAAHPPKETEKCIVLPVEKDVTDTMYAVLKGFAEGFRSFVLVGCLGGERFDHSLANIEVLQYICVHGGKALLAEEHTKVFLLRDERLRLTDSVGATVSVFPYNGKTCNVSYSGLQYPLDHDTLTCGGLLMGVSNSVTENIAEIRVHSGSALIIVYQA